MARSRQPRRIAAKVKWHHGELYPGVGYIVTNLARPAERVVACYNQRGTAEQWIKEGKGAIKWTRLSCRAFAANAVRLQLHVLAYNLGNFMRTLAMPKAAQPWSLTSLREKLIKIGAKVVSHGRYVWFQMAEVSVPRQMFAEILSLIGGCGRGLSPSRRPLPDLCCRHRRRMANRASGSPSLGGSTLHVSDYPHSGPGSSSPREPSEVEIIQQRRIYEIFEANKDAFHARFRDHAVCQGFCSVELEVFRGLLDGLVVGTRRRALPRAGALAPRSRGQVPAPAHTEGDPKPRSALREQS
jgi:Transposase DDE domain group 1